MIKFSLLVQWPRAPAISYMYFNYRVIYCEFAPSKHACRFSTASWSGVYVHVVKLQELMHIPWLRLSLTDVNCMYIKTTIFSISAYCRYTALLHRESKFCLYENDSPNHDCMINMITTTEKSKQCVTASMVTARVISTKLDGTLSYCMGILHEYIVWVCWMCTVCGWTCNVYMYMYKCKCDTLF